MKQVLAVVAVVLLVFNAYLVYDLYFQGGTGSNWQTQPDENGEVALSDLAVAVPFGKLGDMATYDYKIYAEIYWKDFQSGNWSDMRLDITGTQLQWFHSNVIEQNDGFWQKHSTAVYENDMQASFSVYVAGSDSEPLTIPGSLNDQRIEYRDLTEKIPIDTNMKADVTIDRLPRVNKALTYKGEIEYYANPNREVSPSLDEQIFGDGKSIKLNDNGTVAEEKYYALYDFTFNTYYNWSADRASLYKGYKTLHINVTSHTEYVMDYNEQTWISSDMPFPVKKYQRTNQTYTDENGTFWYAVEITTTLQDKGFNSGNIDIPWGTCKGNHWADRNPDGEFKQYNYVPPSGNGYSASSFDFKVEDADTFAQANSPGLQSYLAQYDGVTMIGAVYNASKNPLDVNGKAGSYRWNLTYGYFPTEAEWEEAQETHNYNFTYSVVVIKNVTKDLTKPLQSQYIENVEIENDWGRKRGYSYMPRSALPGEGLTLAASEDIMMKQPMVKENIADNNGEIDWGNFETYYALSLTGMSDDTSPGMQIVELLTGIKMPTANYAWVVQKGTVYESGSTFTAAVDVENGQMVYAMTVEGTALMGLFG
jgi:hypothetical protein